MKRLWLIALLVVSCSKSEQAQREQDSLRTAQRIAEERRDSIIRASPDKYLRIQIDSVIEFQRSRSGNEVVFSIENQTPFLADSIKVSIFTQRIDGFRHDSAYHVSDTLQVSAISVPARMTQRIRTQGHFSSVDSIAITQKLFR